MRIAGIFFIFKEKEKEKENSWTCQNFRVAAFTAMQMLGGASAPHCTSFMTFFPVFFFFFLFVFHIILFSARHFCGHYGIGETGSANGTTTDFRQVGARARNLYSTRRKKKKNSEKQWRTNEDKVRTHTHTQPECLKEIEKIHARVQHSLHSLTQVMTFIFRQIFFFFNNPQHHKKKGARERERERKRRRRMKQSS